MDISFIRNELNKCLDTYKTDDYSGYDKFDALNSPILSLLSFNNQYLRFLFQQIVKESPINLRPILFIPKSRNIKGISLFILTYLKLYKLTKNEKMLRDAQELSTWLISNRSEKYFNLCWGHNFIWQGLNFTLQEKSPNITNTVFSGLSQIELFKITNESKYLNNALSVATFLNNDLPHQIDTSNELAFSYFTFLLPVITINIQSLAAIFFMRLFEVTNNSFFLYNCQRLLNFVEKNMIKTSEGYYWYYDTSQRNKLKNKVDNYHTGFIIDSFIEYYRIVKDKKYNDLLKNSIMYYKDNLFSPEGTPFFNNNKKYPYDIHGAAQGIITFSKATSFDNSLKQFANKIVVWTFNNMYRYKTHDFIFRISRYYKWNYPLMRWSNAWMGYALSEYLGTE